jgi:hypothetical protein
MEPDEGIVLQGAQRILQGEVLYKDFFSFFTPGSYYLLAFLFNIFGSSIVVARSALAVFGAIYSVLTYLLARRGCSRLSSAFVASLVTLTTLPYRFLVLHNWDSTLWACLSLYCAIRLLESAERTWAFAVGSFASLTFLFEQSKGAGLVLGLGIGFLAIAFVGPGDRSLRKYQPGTIVLGLAWPLAATFAYFGTQQGLTTMLHDWLWPLQHYSRANHVPYGYLGWSDSTRHALFGRGLLLARLFYALTFSPFFVLPILPLLAVGLLVYWTLQMRRQGAASGKCHYYVLVCAVLSGLLLSIVVARADIIHFMYLQPLFCLVLAWIVDGRDIPGRLFKTVRPAVIVFISASFLALSMAVLMRAARAPYWIETRRGAIKTPSKDTVIDYTQAHLAPGETLFVYPYLPLYYYLTGTFSPFRYEYFQPGMNTTAQAHEILSQLASRRVPTVLFEPSFPEKIPNSWPGTPLAAITHDPIADYVAREYRTCAILQSPEKWKFLFLVRRNLACPDSPAGFNPL